MIIVFIPVSSGTKLLFKSTKLHESNKVAHFSATRYRVRWHVGVAPFLFYTITFIHVLTDEHCMKQMQINEECCSTSDESNSMF